SIRKANASRFVIPHPLLYLPYRVLSFTYFIYYIPESDKRGVYFNISRTQRLITQVVFLFKQHTEFFIQMQKVQLMF
ncbi:MAG: hypothetical protein KME05_15600, partial [Gloeocapsa sp. UFS-A4-WI-NPMV-4B04]|nr:hypothetical protein [Gloeocapsa sp. UFS-A4-WI-NPMV-4B04]